jgi:hypothetical protein
VSRSGAPGDDHDVLEELADPALGPTSLIVSRATRGKSPVAHIARVRALKARSSSVESLMTRPYARSVR